MKTTITLPAFSKIKINEVEKKLDVLLKKNLDTIDTLLNNNTSYTWDNLLQPIENINDALHQLWSPVNHLSSVVNSKALRETIQACLPKLSDYHTRISHNEKLFRAMESIRNSGTFLSLTAAQQMIYAISN